MNTSHIPSKQFLIRGGIATAIIAIVLIVQTDWFRALFRKDPLPDLTDRRIGEVVAQDSNGNGLPDWEERLWGLDPTKLYTNGRPNTEIIAEKKRSLGIDETDEGPINETDRFARELFSVTSALGQETALGSASLGEAGAELGATVSVNPINEYSLRDITTTASTVASLTTYRNNLEALTNKHQSTSPDLNIIIEGLETGDFSRVGELTKTANDYQVYARALKGLRVPVSVAEYHLDIMNGMAGMARSFESLIQVEDNSVVALQGLALYRHYHLLLEASLYDLNDYFIQYGILR